MLDKLKIERHHKKALELYDRFLNCDDGYIDKHIKKALNALGDALRLYGPDQVLSSYNGGKDADVTMHLLRASVAKYSFDKGVIFSPKLVYFEVEDDFEEVIEHIANTEQLFDLEIKRYHCGIVEGIKQHMTDSGVSPAFVLGTRKGDPNSGCQETFSPSRFDGLCVNSVFFVTTSYPSDWMPVPFMRVNPILHWEYGHVWHFLRIFDLPHCELYDRGYTSLGKRALTRPNPALKKRRSSLLIDSEVDSSEERDEYWPAHLLEDWSLERAGRIDPKKSTSCDSGVTTSHSVLSAPMTAGLIIVSDEILHGVTHDVFSSGTIRALRPVNLQVNRMIVVRDLEQDIAEELRRMAFRYEVVVLVSPPKVRGSTVSAVAKALGKTLVAFPDTQKFVKSTNVKFVKSTNVTTTDSDTDAQSISDGDNHMPLLPESTELLFAPPVVSNEENFSENPVKPIMRCENVFLVSGSHPDFDVQIEALAAHFLTKQQKTFRSSEV